MLKTGNRLNTGTFRGDAQAFKLDNLLKLADVKAANGTTLLHFVIQEIVKSEAARAARLSGSADPTTPSTPSTPQSPNSSHFAANLEAAMNNTQSENVNGVDSKRMGMAVVLGLPTELSNVKKAGAMDASGLKQAVVKLVNGLQGIKSQVQEGKFTEPQGMECKVKDSAIDLSEDSFQAVMEAFVKKAETNVSTAEKRFNEVFEAVKKVSMYFYGEAAAKDDKQPLKVFVVVREFLGMLEQACKDVMKSIAPPSKSNTLSPLKPQKKG